MKKIKMGGKFASILMALTLTLASSLISLEVRAADNARDPDPGTEGATCDPNRSNCIKPAYCCGIRTNGQFCTKFCGPGAAMTTNNLGAFIPRGSQTVTDAGVDDSGVTLTNVVGHYKMADGSMWSCTTTVKRNGRESASAQCEPFQVTNIEETNSDVANAITNSITSKKSFMFMKWVQ